MISCFFAHVLHNITNGVLGPGLEAAENEQAPRDRGCRLATIVAVSMQFFEVSSLNHRLSSSLTAYVGCSLVGSFAQLSDSDLQLTRASTELEKHGRQ